MQHQAANRYCTIAQATRLIVMAMCLPIFSIYAQPKQTKPTASLLKQIYVATQHGTPVERARIEYFGEKSVKDKSEWQFLGVTNQTGTIEIRHTCNKSILIRVLPHNYDLYRKDDAGRTIPCSEKIQLEVWLQGLSGLAPKTQIARIVVEDELGRPARAVVNKVSDSGRISELGHIASSTTLDGLTEGCEPGAKIQIRLEASNYSVRNAEKPCGESVRFVAVRQDIAPYLLKYADTAYFRQQYGLATLLYGEGQRRLADVDSESARKAEQRTYLAASGFFRVKEDEATSIDVAKGGDLVMSPTLRKRVEAYQRARGLPIDGQLGYETRKKMAGDKPIFSFIKAAYTAAESESTGSK